MPVLVGSTPPGPGTDPPPPVPKFSDHPTLIWNGWTGDSWILAGDRNADTFIEQDGLGGILEPPVQHYFSESVRDGSTWQGYRIPARPCTIPLFVWGDTPHEMRDEDKRFRRTLRPEQTATLIVADPNSGEKRQVVLRYLAGAEGSFSGETYGKNWIRYNLSVIAEDPYFYGDEKSYSFKATTPSNFYGGTPGGFGPPFYIGSSQTIASAEVFNPGTEPAYVIWDIQGAMTAFQGGWPGAQINLPIALTAAESLEVNSDPDWNTIIDQAGLSRWPDVGGADITFAPLPAEVSTNLGLVITAPDSNTVVQVRFRPKYRSAW